MSQTPPLAPRPSVEPTTWTVVVVAVLGGVAVASLALSALDAVSVTGLELGGWSTPVLLAAAAVAGLALAWSTRQHNQVLRRPAPPQRTLLVLVIGKTMLLGGALLAGAYATVVFRNLDRFEIPGPRERVIVGAAATIAAALLGLAGWLVERACRIPPAGESPESPNSPAGE